jgi:hypothetical protein
VGGYGGLTDQGRGARLAQVDAMGGIDLLRHAEVSQCRSFSFTAR